MNIISYYFFELFYCLLLIIQLFLFEYYFILPIRNGNSLYIYI